MHGNAKLKLLLGYYGKYQSHILPLGRIWLLILLLLALSF